MIQWLPLDLPPTELRTILRTFLAVFPETYVWTLPPHYAFVIGLEAPLIPPLVK